jgi:signal transduction histidine kinase
MAGPRLLLTSVRVRITLAALVVVAVALAAGGAALLWLLNRSLTNGVIGNDQVEAGNVSGIVASGELPTHLPTRAGTGVQVVDATGRVLAASADLAGRPAVSGIRPPPGTRMVLRTPRALAGDDDEASDLTVATTVLTRRGPLTVYVVASDDPTEDSLRALAVALAIVLPSLAVLSGGLAWVLAGRALRPVEAIRVEVAEISAADLHRRVPEPPIHDEIGRLAETMNAMLARLEASTERQQKFVSDASHELRSPIASIVAQVEVAEAHPERADWDALARVVAAEAARLAQIVDDLLLLARSDEGELAPGHDPVDLDELVLAEADRMRVHGRVDVDLHRVSAGRVSGDPEQLRRVVRNLAENAERHARSRVAFEVARADGWVELVVADDGPGIPVQDRRRVFERFARLDEARDRPTGGTGLGLAIVGEIVASHGGSVSVADAQVGARFVVLLPATGT